MDDVRLLKQAQLRHTLASIEVSLIHGVIWFNRLNRTLRQVAAQLEDVYLTFEVERMWDEARTTPVAAPAAARTTLGAAPGGVDA